MFSNGCLVSRGIESALVPSISGDRAAHSSRNGHAD
jgi:hypothetical protein